MISNPNIVLQTTELTRYFGKFCAVNSVSIDVRELEIIGLLGPNGAGKSTLIKILTTPLSPSAGKATICGFDLKQQSANIRRLIGYIPQLISADGNLTGYENLLIFSKLYDIPPKERESRIESALEVMGLTDAATRYVKEYSGGMVRRLEILQAFLHRPRILFLDEPTPGLDPMARDSVWKHLQKAHDEYKMTIVLTTHDMEEANYLCHRISIMNQGKIVITDTPEVLKKSIGPDATLNDVFIRYGGNVLGATVRENFRDIARQRSTEEKRK